VIEVENQSDVAIQNSTVKRDNLATLQLVSFRLHNALYGIEITRVQEIILLGEITRIPQTPNYIKGLINLRSTVIPIVDLRSRFSLNEAKPTDETRIMVVNVGGKTVGIIVDAVNEVMRVKQDEISSPPDTIAGKGREYFTGLINSEQGLLILLDIDQFLSGDENLLSEKDN